MRSDATIIEESLEIVAQRCDDLVPLVYRRFYETWPDTRSMFGRDENSFHQGQMFNGMLIAVIEHAEGRCNTGSVRAWAMDHDALGVKREMFPAMFAAMLDTIRDCLGDDWTTQVSDAWTRQISGLASRFEEACEQMIAGRLADVARRKLAQDTSSLRQHKET